MKINVDYLINTVHNHFSTVADYRMAAKKWRSLPEATREYYYRNKNCSDEAIYDLCKILGINYSKLYTIARLARKWEQKRNWEQCFPSDTMADKILSYLEN